MTMPHKQDPRWSEMASRFREQAEGELRAAAALLLPDLYFASVEHARLGAELGLKSLLWRTEGRGIRGHDVGVLLAMAKRKVGSVPARVHAAADILVTVPLEARYPDAAKPIPMHRYEAVHSQACLEAAREILAWVDGWEEEKKLTT